MEIPHNVTARPDTGLYNAKLGIWLFLASEVMLFGGLFSGYIFLRLGAEDGYWSHGLLNVPVGTFNTAVLIASSVTIVLTWANLKMRNWIAAQRYLLITILCGTLFLVVKLAYEYPQKFHHFGAYIKKDSIAKYEEFLGNEHVQKRNKEEGWTKFPARYEITGHLHGILATKDGQHVHLHEGTDFHSIGEAELLPRKGYKIDAYEVQVDSLHDDPTSKANEHVHFIPRPLGKKIAKIDAADVQFSGAFTPKHNSYFAIYFTITGLHGLHVLGGVIVMAYFYFFGHQIYKKNPEHQANRIEVVGLFWHFVDLVWIFVFPIFYLL